MTFTIRDDNGTERTFETRAEAEEQKEELEQLGAEVELIVDGEEETTKVEEETTDVVEPDVEPTEDTPAVTEESDPLAQLGEELETDPLSILPGHMVDHIQGQPAVNKRGYAMIAERYGIETSAEILQFPWENDENRCVAKAIAITQDGKKYSGHATACKEDGDMKDQLIELAETRALKRSVSWASGVGIVSYQELSGQLEKDP